MCRNLIVMAVMLALASTSYGVMVGNWETSSLEGWDNCPTWYAESHATLTTVGGELEVSGIPLGDATYLGTRGFDTDGVTPLYNYDPKYPDCWWFLRGDHSAGCFLPQAKAPGVFGTSVFRMQVSGIPEGATLRGFIHFGGAGVGYGKTDMVLTPDACGNIIFDYINDLTGRAPVPPEELYVDELWTDAGSWTWDGIHLYDAVNVATWAPSWFQICIAMESPDLGENGSPTATLYVDSARFVPEPTTIALLGLGGLALIRRKR